ncbi:alpha/beta fold hydrolase [Saccharothrix australiensis]|uniref:alpha/beta fold hydrolase n=1 Tax=Saccharothrix australiensis TaxID=2072 RepID=UPI00147742C8|nr:alpha/beta fold hydrolase [Saccharothrix australiensis]
MTLVLGRLKAEGRARGSVLVGFGGPSGGYVRALGDLFGEAYGGLRRRMDVVTWDIRGGPGNLGMSTPRLRCDWRMAVVPRYPRDEAEYEQLTATNRADAEKCRSTDPELFDNMDSASNARDMEAIRRALGEPKLNFYGASYAGFFGQAYARLFPHRVRTLVLDGTWSHSNENWQSELAALAQDHERTLRRFFDWCAADTSCALHGGDASRHWREVTARADREPIPAPSVDADYSGRDLRALGLLAALRGPERWGRLAEAIRDAERGDASGFAPAGARLPYPAVPAPGAVECLDWPRAHGYQRLSAMTDQLHRTAPHVGASAPLPMNLLRCEGWPTPVTNPPQPLPRHLPPLLGAGAWNEIDAVGRVVAQVPGSRTIRHEAAGHTLYLDNPCARAHIDRYLTSRIMPEPGTEC